MLTPDSPNAVFTKSTSLSEEEFQSFFDSVEAGIPFNEAIYKFLQKKDGGKWQGVGYAFTKDNLLPSNWLQQTPNVWGQPANKVKYGAGLFITTDIQQLIAGAKQFVDITSLHPYADGAFETVIRNGLAALAVSGQKVIVRILTGWDPSIITFMSCTGSFSR